MYFSLLPNIEYNDIPLSFPFSESEYVVAKNLFKKYRINQDVFSYAVFFKKYVILEGETPDVLANKAYGDPFFDWVVLLTNNITDRHFQWPMSNYELQKYAEQQYDDPYSEVAYYETYEVKSGFKLRNELNVDVDAVALEAGLRVDQTFFNKPFTYFDGAGYRTVPGNTVCKPVTVIEDLTKKNEESREIYLLKPPYFRQFVDDFTKQALYKKGAASVKNNFLKRAGI